MIAQGLEHLTHAAASTAAVLHLPDRARSVAPALLTIAGFTPLQVEVMVTGIGLFAQALIFAAFQVKTALGFHYSFRRASVGR